MKNMYVCEYTNARPEGVEKLPSNTQQYSHQISNCSINRQNPTFRSAHLNSIRTCIDLSIRNIAAHF